MKKLLMSLLALVFCLSSFKGMALTFPESSCNKNFSTLNFTEYTSISQIFKEVDSKKLKELINSNNEDEILETLAPTIIKISNYVKSRYNQDISSFINESPRECLVIGLFYLGQENGITDFPTADASSGGDEFFNCFKAALGALVGLPEIHSLYAAFTGGNVTVSTAVGALKFIGRRTLSGIAIGLMIYEVGDCLGWW